MESGNNEAKKAVPGKKELKKQLADKMELALPELREMLGDKKFTHRLKKAAKLLIEGLHKEDVPKGEKKPVAKKGAAKKVAVKKGAVKQPVAKATPVKKATTAKNN